MILDFNKVQKQMITSMGYIKVKIFCSLVQLATQKQGGFSKMYENMLCGNTGFIVRFSELIFF